MTHTRRIILHWAEQGHIAGSDLPRALALAEVLPSREMWRRFLDRLLLWMGTVLVAAGVIFFLAYNWKDIGHFAKFSMVEVLVVVALLFVWRLGLDRSGGKAALFGASLFLGALLALIGQTYQTGADTFELFGVWAAMILPWVLLGRLAALWLLWLTLVNLTIILYFQAFPSVFGLLFSTERVLWVLFAFNTAALAAWEAAAACGIAWVSRRWVPRFVATASGGCVTALAMIQIVEWGDAGIWTIPWAIPAWLAWLGATWAVYRHATKDLFMLTAGVFSAIIVVATFFGHLADGDPGGFLLVGLIVIAMSAVGGMWLNNVAEEDGR